MTNDEIIALFKKEHPCYFKEGKDYSHLFHVAFSLAEFLIIDYKRHKKLAKKWYDLKSTLNEYDEQERAIIKEIVLFVHDVYKSNKNIHGKKSHN